MFTIELSTISITNFRSITDAYRIALQNYTVLIGKNNEGKTNVLKALKLGMEIIHNSDLISRRRIIPKQLYDWSEDFPISLQTSRKLKNKNTRIRLDFLLNSDETSELYYLISSSINRELSIFIEIRENNSVSITVPKRGKNTRSLSEKIVEICRFICDKFDVQNIQAVRSEDDAYELITELIETEFTSISDDKYLESLEYIEDIQRQHLQSLSQRVCVPLKAFIPQINSVNLCLKDRYRANRYMARKSVTMDIDDGARTNLSFKGDGIKSLVVIAMLSQVVSAKNRIIVVDEPESHLHPEAIRYINSVLIKMSEKNQILIATHNPIFVNRWDMSSNYIVENGKAKKTEYIDQIRENLGVMCSDNLVYANYVVVVEGKTDKAVLEKIFRADDFLNQCMNSNFLMIRSIGGTRNLKAEICALERFFCNYLVVVDYDKAGREGASAVRESLHLQDEQFRYFARPGRGESELEELYLVSKCKDTLLEFHLDVSLGPFKNKAKKWTDRIRDLALLQGRELSENDIGAIKEALSDKIDSNWRDFFKPEGCQLMESLMEKVVGDIKRQMTGKLAK